MSHLRSEQRERRLFAARRLKDVVYPELLAALETVQTDDEEIRLAIEAALDVHARLAG